MILICSEEVEITTIYEDVMGSQSAGNVIEGVLDEKADGKTGANASQSPNRSLRKSNRKPSKISKKDLAPEWVGELSPVDYVIAMARLGDQNSLNCLRNLPKKRHDPGTAKLLMKAFRS